MTNIYHKAIPILVLVILCVPSLFANAHGSGASFETEVDGYVVDVGYSPDEFQVGVSVNFDFSLTNVSSGDPQEFTDIWVRIGKDGETIFATGIAKARFGLTRMLYTFDESGDYEISLRFQNDDESIVEASFPFNVESNQPDTGGVNIVRIAAALIVGLLVGAITVGSLGILLGKK